MILILLYFKRKKEGTRVVGVQTKSRQSDDAKYIRGFPGSSDRPLVGPEKTFHVVNIFEFKVKVTVKVEVRVKVKVGVRLWLRLKLRLWLR